MKISITQKELDAINFGMNQIQDAIEGSSDEDYIESASEAVDNLDSIMKKYQKARSDADDLNETKRFIRKRNGFMPPSKLDRMARALIRIRRSNGRHE